MRPIQRLIVCGFFLFSVAPWRVAADGANSTCRVTRPPNPPFVPALPYKSAANGQFLIGADELWAVVRAVNWKVGVSGNKLPYFRRGYNYMAEQTPDLQLTARRLDAPAALVTGGRASWRHDQQRSGR